MMIGLGLMNLGFHPMVDFIVQDDGEGAYLRGWLSDKPQPTNEAIEAASLAPPSPRVVTMWRARTIMKVTQWGNGTLFDAVQAAIASMTDPLTKAAAEEALDRGDVFDLDGQVAPRLMQAVGMTEAQALELLRQAASLPA